ncbi:MAG: hypothetical protein NTZ61_13110 [Proteobacteria bacterium]|nr:hypothetical protein [Pseudomonadota bacterium]
MGLLGGRARGWHCGQHVGDELVRIGAEVPVLRVAEADDHDPAARHDADELPELAVHEHRVVG